MKTTVWKRKDKTMRIKDIKDKHLLNIIDLINRAKDKSVRARFPSYKVLINEARKRGLLEVI